MLHPVNSQRPWQIALAGITLTLAGYAVGNIAAKLVAMLGS